MASITLEDLRPKVRETNVVAGVTPSITNWIAAQAVTALIEEANLTPKPGLVDQRGSGAHSDLTLEMMHRSAHSLLSCFTAIAIASQGRIPSRQLRERLVAIGREGESEMFAATGGCNSHKGAIWTLGLLLSGAILSSDLASPQAIASMAASIAAYPHIGTSQEITNGARVEQLYGVTGARGEACEGFPHVLHIGLPALIDARARGVPEQWARLDALMAIMTTLDDTCLLHRGGMEALHAAQSGAQRVLRAGGTSTVQGLELLLRLDGELLDRNVSPGGSADLLAATLFLDYVTSCSAAGQTNADPYGDVELWRN